MSVVYLRRRHAGSLFDWRALTEVFDAEVAVWPICVLDALAACVLTAVVTLQLLSISGESRVRQSKLTVTQRLYNVFEFAVGRGAHADDQLLCRRVRGDCVI